MITIIKHNPVKDGFVHDTRLSVLVDSASDLVYIDMSASPGSIAHTAGYEQMWEKGNDGTWVLVGGE